MQLTPRYDDPGFLRIDGIGDPGGPLLAQRRRLVATLGQLDDGQWARPSRCDGWSVQDVATHLVSTNQFWAFSILAGLGGEPSRFLATFDPVASPAQLVEAARSQSSGEVLAQLIESTDALADAVGAIGSDGWTTLAEAPPGHVPLYGLALHALWDAWVHERDIALPLGLAVVEDPEEIDGCLRYAATLSPAFSASRGSTRRGSIAVQTTDPEVRILVEVGSTITVRDLAGDEATPGEALDLRGPAVEVLEALSRRVPFAHPVPDEHGWLLDGLAAAFDQT